MARKRAVVADPVDAEVVEAKAVLENEGGTVAEADPAPPVEVVEETLAVAPPAPAVPSVSVPQALPTVEDLLAEIDARPIEPRPIGLKPNGQQETELDTLGELLREADMGVKHAQDDISRMLAQRWFDRVQRAFNMKMYVK